MTYHDRKRDFNPIKCAILSINDVVLGLGSNIFMNFDKNDKIREFEIIKCANSEHAGCGMAFLCYDKVINVI